MFRHVQGFLPALFGVVATVASAAGGDLDPTFGRGGIALLSLDGVEGHELRVAQALTLPDGKLLFGGSRNFRILGNPDPNMRAMIARVNADGTPDDGFGGDPANPGILVLPSISPTAIQRIEGLARLDDGSIVAAGSAFALGPVSGWIAKFDADGHPDAAFGDGGRVDLASTYVHALAIDGEGRIVVAGERLVHVEGDPAGVLRGNRAIVARFGNDGRADGSFGGAGEALLDVDVETDNAYMSQLVLDTNDGIFVGGAYEDNTAFASYFSLAHLDVAGRLDANFAGGGWRRFSVPGDVSLTNGIDAMAPDARGGVTFAGHRDSGDGTTSLVLGQVTAAGADDSAFGNPATPGYIEVPAPASAYYRTARALLRQDDGKLLVAVSYSAEAKQDFVLARTGDDGALDASFGEGGIVDLDLAPDGGAYSDLTALTLQNGKPVLAGTVKQDPASLFADLGIARLVDDTGTGDDVIFNDGFDAASVPPGSVSHYDDLAEGFLGETYTYQGVTYHDANGIPGVFPDGNTFTAEEVGNLFAVENARLFYVDHPEWGSSPNALTFGRVFIPGDNLSLGPLVRASMDLDTVAEAASFQMAYYERGPWGGIVLHLDALLDGNVVGSDELTIASGGDRDNLTTGVMSISGVNFDALRFYATYGGQPTAPRVMIDNLALTPAR